MNIVKKSLFAKSNEKKANTNVVVETPKAVQITMLEVHLTNSEIYMVDLLEKASLFKRFCIKKGCLYRGFKKLGQIKFIEVTF